MTEKSHLPMYVLHSAKGPEAPRRFIPDHTLPKAGSVWLLDVGEDIAKVTVLGVTAIQEESLLLPGSTIVAKQLLDKVRIFPPDVVIASNAVGQLFGYTHDELVSSSANRASINRWIVYRDVNGIHYATLPYEFLETFVPDRRKEKHHGEEK